MCVRFGFYADSAGCAVNVQCLSALGAGKGPSSKGGPVYIGIGTLVFILVVLLIIWFVRRV